MSERSTRQARQLVRRLARDCNLEWPGGEENAALLYDRSTRRWELRCIDSTPSPVIRGPTPLTHLLRRPDSCGDGLFFRRKCRFLHEAVLLLPSLLLVPASCGTSTC